MALAFVQGMGIGASLIMAVGAQNAFVLKQGISRQHVLPIALLCSLIDALMISFGVLGFGTLVERYPMVTHIASFGGAAFLLVYGFNALRASFKENQMVLNSHGGQTLSRAILATLAISLLNPHLYLDTVVLLGSISTQFVGEERQLFGAGAILSSFLWFFALSYGSRYLAPLFQKPMAWRILDRAIFVMMWAIAAAILWPYLANLSGY